jgi:hypothetical protein
MVSSADKEKTSLRNVINKIIEGKIDANRRYIDEVLEKVQDQNRLYYLEKLAIEVTRMELEAKEGNLHRANYHKIMVGVYKDILEKTFPDAQ